MSIIEKLGITPIEEFTIAGRTSLFCLVEPVRNLEQQYNEMLEALIEECYWEDKEGKGANSDWISLIEKACYPKAWQEIKEMKL